MRCLVVLLVAAVAVARAAEEPFYLRHMEFRRLVVAVEAGQPATAGNALVAHYAEEPATDALMFTQDPQTQSIITVDGGLCITDDNGTPPVYQQVATVMMAIARIAAAAHIDSSYLPGGATVHIPI